MRIENRKSDGELRIENQNVEGERSQNEGPLILFFSRNPRPTNVELVGPRIERGRDGNKGIKKEGKEGSSSFEWMVDGWWLM